MEFVDKIYEIGERPPLGTVPRRMYAWTIRNERLGSPETAFGVELVDVPMIRDDELLVYNISAGINYNGIWAATGKPKNVIDSNGDYFDEKQDFHICGSESCGIVYAVGKNVKNYKVGDIICVGGSKYSSDDKDIQSGMDPCFSPSYHIWGYESNYGAFAQFSRVQECQCVKKADNLDFDEAACAYATGVTAYRMLNGWKGNTLKKGDVVLIWGGAGGLGISAIQITKALGGIPVAVVSSEEKGELCKQLGAAGYIDRSKFDHWGSVSSLSDKEYRSWIAQATKFRRSIWKIVGEKRSPAIVLEHPGRDTLPTSLFVCGNGGMVVLCGATSSYMADIDLRFLWLNQRRIQGSHAGTQKDAAEYIKLVEKYDIHPYIGKKYDWSELPKAHEDFAKKVYKGKLVVRIGAE
ncbi:crotonyl-CoA carboxylase/reductase [Ruminococcus sp.]|uniref:crotonyl-CoA carboxylase/reductase n=1 Tax=Ruminococcus sp. TaxID=41978 RepID=UPI0025F69083|nr:crotonyl-CoA carboxylase/reductase [Ruminococcus sp.]MBR1432003.1 crotonyl-CoA carboxylase/reductase [Ruminococcus sp.]